MALSFAVLALKATCKYSRSVRSPCFQNTREVPENYAIEEAYRPKARGRRDQTQTPPPILQQYSCVHHASQLLSRAHPNIANTQRVSSNIANTHRYCFSTAACTHRNYTAVHTKHRKYTASQLKYYEYTAAYIKHRNYTAVHTKHPKYTVTHHAGTASMQRC